MTYSLSADELVRWLCKAVCRPITNHLATVFWLLSGMASCFISGMASSFISKSPTPSKLSSAQFFPNDLPQAFKRHGCICRIDDTPQGIINQSLIALALAFGMSAKSGEHIIIQIHRYPCFTF